MESVSVETKPAKRVLSVYIYFNCNSIASMFNIKLRYEAHLDSYRVIHNTDEYNLHAVSFKKEHISRIRRHYNKEKNVLFSTVVIDIDGKIKKEDI